MDLNTIWFLLIFVLLTGYAILDGFDLGVGVLHLFARNEHERRISLNSIGPVWDGNEVWLLTGGGALFAAFPPVYATVFSGFYIALMLLLTALIFRAVSLEFRGKVDSPVWRRFWDYAFGLGSLVAALLLAVALGNILRGIPVNAEGDFTGNFLTLLNPFALLVGVTGLVLIIMHGAGWLALKSEGELRDRARAWITPCWMTFVVLYIGATIYAVFAAPHLFDGATGKPLFWVFLLLLLAGVVAAPIMHRAGRDLHAFLASAAIVAAVMALSAVGLFPNLAPSTTDPAFSLNVHDHSSTDLTLMTMLIIASIGVPLVLIYTAVIYWIFRGKVKLDDVSY
jgi:cytochrome d ubiquinol oxidase subunit II